MPKWTKSYTFFGLLRASESAHLLVTLTYIQYVASMRRETGILAMHDKYIDTARAPGCARCARCGRARWYPGRSKYSCVDLLVQYYAYMHTSGCI